MKKFLRRVELIDDLSIELEISQNEFVNQLKQRVELKSVGFLSSPFLIFSAGKKKFHGFVGTDSFKIRRKRTLFDHEVNMAIATGTHHQKEDTLVIDTEINGFSMFMIPKYVVATVIYLLFAGAIVFFINPYSGKTAFILLFVAVHAIFMFVMPYMMMRGSVRQLKRELEKELSCLTKNQAVDHNSTPKSSKSTLFQNQNLQSHNL